MDLKPKLVSFKLCPFVQKAVIVLLQKQIDYDIEYIDLANPPDWFLKISPLGKVPVLIMGDDAIFESSAIIEFIEETWPKKLHPADLIQRARNRSWIEYSSPCWVGSFSLNIARDKDSFEQTLKELNDRFDQLELNLKNAPYFNGEEFSLVDACYAPLFHRLQCMDELRSGMFEPGRHPKINRWKTRLLQEDSVVHSTVSNFIELYRELLWTRHGYISTFLDPNLYQPVDGPSFY
ncbi:MAG: glutathione S-transferase family protein [Gammaproteobacteria bacterium]|nr:glutathione S-transferase family protein [Gammaproteobacteria bacterium]